MVEKVQPLEEELPEVGEFIREIANGEESHGIKTCVVENGEVLVRTSKWMRIDDLQRPVQVEKKVGRNDPCLCGSGKKFKKCCGR